MKSNPYMSALLAIVIVALMVGAIAFVITAVSANPVAGVLSGLLIPGGFLALVVYLAVAAALWRAPAK